MSGYRTDETWHRLREWTAGSAAAERLAAQVLLADGYTSVDPSHPLGGPDGGKDLLWRVMTGRFGSTGLIRQTPERLGRSSHWGVLLWGLDTGTPVTTVRASALPLLGVVGVALGFGTVWSGILYAGGYLAVLCWVCSRTRGFFGVSHDTSYLIRELQRVRDRARLAGVLYAGIVAWTLL